MANQPRGSNFVPVTCRCGRSLRAKLDQVGTEIRCWDCHRSVPVPMPRQRLQVARELADGFSGATRGAALGRIAAASMVVTAGLFVPAFGLAVGGGLLLLVATAYGFEIRRVGDVSGEESRPRWSWSNLPGTIARGCLGAALAAGVFYPTWVRHSGPGQPPRFDRAGLTILLASCAALPLLNLMVNGDGRRGMLGPWRTLRLIGRFPVATMAALAVVPAGFFLIELGLAVLFLLQGTFAFFTIEFMPLVDQPIVYMGIPYFDSVDFRSLPGSKFLSIYLAGLRQGRSFLGAFPSSLSIFTRAGIGPNAISVPDSLYPAARGLVTLVIFIVLMTAAAVQARWLGAITAFEKKRPGPTIEGR